MNYLNILQVLTHHMLCIIHTYNTFKTFILHKKKMTLSLFSVDFYISDVQFKEFLFGDMVYDHHSDDSPDIKSWFDNDQNNEQNLFKRLLLRVFTHIEVIEIDARDGHYPFSLMTLLSIIQGTSVIEVRINGCPGSQLKSFLYWNNIANAYESNQYRIHCGLKRLEIFKET